MSPSPAMNCRWRFLAVLPDRSRFHLRRSGRPIEVRGSDADALNRCRSLLETGSTDRWEHLMAETVCDAETDQDRLVFILGPRPDRRGWNLEANDLHPFTTWHLTPECALDYGAFRGRGFLCDFRLVDMQRQVRRRWLLDQRDFVPGLAFPEAASAKIEQLP